jgi:tetratricopeptide (TPR) repeat protein
MANERRTFQSDPDPPSGASGESGPRRQSSEQFGASSKARLSELIAMAMAYRNWTQREVASFVGRDAHNLIPPSGIPKVDLVVRLAQALDWPASAVLEDICGPRSAGKPPPDEQEVGEDFRSLNRASYGACASGEFVKALELALRAAAVASTPDERAEADRRESVAWDYLGRFQSSIEAAQRGLRRPGVSAPLRADLRANLASCYFALGQVHEGEALAVALLHELGLLEVGSDTREAIEAHLLYVRAQCRLHRVDGEPDLMECLAKSARADFLSSSERWARVADRSGVSSFVGRCHICQGGVLATDAVLHLRPTETVLTEFVEGLQGAVDLNLVPKGDPLEGFGWWCIFGASVALRAGDEIAERDRYLAIFANKAYEIADLSGNWSLRERAFTIDFLRSAMSAGGGGLVLDGEDVRVLTGTMGRFPAFRPLGWEILRKAERI